MIELSHLLQALAADSWGLVLVTTFAFLSLIGFTTIVLFVFTIIEDRRKK